MNRGDLIRRVRAYTRDLNSSIFRNVDVVDFINEGVDRVKSRVPQLVSIPTLVSDDSVPLPLPAQYHALLAIYGASRCFGQDERHYQASTLMNEFEQKLDELISAINNREVIIVDAEGVEIDSNIPVDYVKVEYFASSNIDDEDDGVDGLGG
jgi:hypothetical protein